MPITRLLSAAAAILAVGVVGACSAGAVGGISDASEAAPSQSQSPAAAQSPQPGSSETRYPDVADVKVTDSGGRLSFAVTMTSPYDSPERYADGMRVRSVDGQQVYGERTLTHDHASEQPFTRSIDNVEIPDSVTEVVVEGRDQVSGWGGQTRTVPLPPR